MKRIVALPVAVLTVAWLVALGGCGPQEARPPKAEQARSEVPQPAPVEQPAPSKPAAKPVEASEPEPESAPEAKAVDLGPPLVEHVERLVRLDPKYTVFIDKQKKQVVMVGQVCQRQVPLELFACPKNTKEHEAIVSIPTKAMIVHAALLAVGAEPGEPAHFDPYTPARGQEVAVDLVWKDAKGEIRRGRAQDWVKNASTGKALDKPWIFAGSGFWTDPTTKERHYQAEAGDLICVSNFSSATLDIAVQSSSANDSLAYEAFTERIPPKGTPVTLVLTPQPRKR